MAIQSFANAAIERFFREGRVPPRVRWGQVAKSRSQGWIFSTMPRSSPTSEPHPGNRLEALRGNLLGMHSIRVNDQWRVIFRWTPSGPSDVDFLDYH